MSNVVRNFILGNRYFDSLKLMRISTKAAELKGVDKVSVVMATDLNKEILKEVGLFTGDLEGAKPDDLVIAVSLNYESYLDSVIDFINTELDKAASQTQKTGQITPRTLESALSMLPEANLALISVPGNYAKREARKALEHGLHVLLFSNNVSIEGELELKTLAKSKGLLVMGPGCGTAIINNVPLAFANVVKKGPVGIVAASGTGIQEVSSLLSNAGSGISHAIGTGGRDLSDEIGGITMMQGIEILEKDGQTEVILLISKPPGPQTAKRLAKFVTQCKKSFVVDFIGISESRQNLDTHWMSALTLEDAARAAIALVEKKEIRHPLFTETPNKVLSMAEGEWQKFSSEQQYVRGLYSGGTVCSEATLILSELISPLYSNVPPRPELKLLDTQTSKGNVCLDLGDEEFTVGRAHPMIDPLLRQNRLIQEAQDPTTAVILLDIVLGFGSHPDPGGALVPSIREAKTICAGKGGYLSVMASIIGTHEDPQSYQDQREKLIQAGALIMPSNAQAARLAALIASRGRLANTFFKGDE